MMGKDASTDRWSRRCLDLIVQTDQLEQREEISECTEVVLSYKSRTGQQVTAVTAADAQRLQVTMADQRNVLVGELLTFALNFHDSLSTTPATPNNSV